MSWGIGPPTLVGDADYSNIHAYRNNGLQPSAGLDWYINHQKSAMPNKPMVLTETGYYTLPGHNQWEGVDGRSQAAMSLNTIFRADAWGLSETYLYQFLDQYSDPTGTNREAHWGFYDLAWNAKPIAHAFHNLTTILADAGAGATTFATGSLTYSVSGLPSHGGTKLLQKSDGSFDLVVWAEPDIWDEAGNRPITAPTTQVTVDLGATYGTWRNRGEAAGGRR
jgi:hypothetical protein